MATDYITRHSEVLRRRFPAVAETFEGHESDLSGKVEVSMARSGAPTASVITSEGRFLLHSRFDPAVEAERWAREVTRDDPDFLVVVGMALGYHLERLLQERPGLRLIVVEPDRHVFVAAMSARDQTAWLLHPHLEILVTDDAESTAANLVGRYRKRFLGRGKLALWPATTRYAPGFCSTLQGKLLDLLRMARVSIATHRTFSLQWIENFFANMSRFPSDPGVNVLFNGFRGRPGIIASAGPSLERNIHLLSEAKGRAVVIAAGSTINPLLQHRIEPDILVSFDPGEANYRHFERLRTPTLPLVYVPTIYPRVLEEYAGPRFMAAMDVFPFIGWFMKELGEERGWLSSGPSVANVCWHLALQMGLNPIILVGQDLAYTDNRSHAAGAAHARDINIDPNQLGSKYLEVEAVGGGTVVTDRPMYSMKVWFEERIRQAPAGHITIDATEGGARIVGTDIMTLREALDTYCSEAFDPHTTLLEFHCRERERLSGLGLEDRLKSVLDGVDQGLQNIERLIDVGLRDGRQVLTESKTKRLTDQRYREAERRFGRLVVELERNSVYRFLVAPLMSHVIESVGVGLQPQREKETDLKEKGRLLARQYLVVFGNVRRISRHIRRQVRRVPTLSAK